MDLHILDRESHSQLMRLSIVRRVGIDVGAYRARYIARLQRAPYVPVVSRLAGCAGDIRRCADVFTAIAAGFAGTRTRAGRATPGWAASKSITTGPFSDMRSSLPLDTNGPQFSWTYHGCINNWDGGNIGWINDLPPNSAETFSTLN